MQTIMLSQSLFVKLEREAQRAQVSPNELAEKLLSQQLAVNSEDWPTQFEALLKRIHNRIAQLSPEAIEADITLAAEEVKTERRARRAS
jgi:hypothetical protein